MSTGEHDQPIDFGLKLGKKNKKQEDAPVAADPLQVAQLEQSVRDGNAYRFENSHQRYVLCVGRSRSGKSTQIGVLKDPTYQAEGESIFSQTMEPRYHSFALDCVEQKIKYNIHLIDTPGLHEVNPIDSESVARADDEILNAIFTCMKNEVVRINVLMIFLSVSNGVSGDDIDCFRKYTESFYHENVPILICITRADGKDRAWKKSIQEELGRHPYFHDLLQKNNVKVCFMGCVDGNAKKLSSIETLKRLYEDVYLMREEVLEHIFNANHNIPLLQLPATLAPQLKAEKLLDEELSVLKELEEMKEFDNATAKSNLHKVTKIHNDLNKLGMVKFMENKEVITKVRLIEQKIKALANQLPEKIKVPFFSQLGY